MLVELIPRMVDGFPRVVDGFPPVRELQCAAQCRCCCCRLLEQDFLFGRCQFCGSRKKGRNGPCGRGTYRNCRAAVQDIWKLDGRSGRSCSK